MERTTDPICPTCRTPIGNRSKIQKGPEHINPLTLKDRIWRHSSKTKLILQELIRVIKTTDDKCLVFSQWTSMLDLIEIPLDAHDIKFVRIDGTKSIKERDEAITLFTDKLNIRVCLLSLKSAGLGLNLTMGNHVFFLDPWWNPQMELQCIDRAHRLGQEKEVFVYRFIVKESIEERILKLQEEKKKIADTALDKGGVISLSRLTPEDLRFLFAV